MTRIRTDQIRENPLRPRHPRSHSFALLEKCPDISVLTDFVVVLVLRPAAMFLEK